jgi:hypothetical protein
MKQLEAPKLSIYNMASVFNYYRDDDGFDFFNILKRINLNIDSYDDKEVFSEYLVLPSDTYTKISYSYYGTIELWWLICLVNKINNPFKKPEPGFKIYLLRPAYAMRVLDSINNPDAQ